MTRGGTVAETAFDSFACNVCVGCTSSPPPTPTAKPGGSETKPGRPPSRPAASPTTLPQIRRPHRQPGSDKRVAATSPAAHVFVWGHREEADRDSSSQGGRLHLGEAALEWRNIEKNPQRTDFPSGPSLTSRSIRSTRPSRSSPGWTTSRTGPARTRSFPASGPPDNMEDGRILSRV